MKLGSFAFLPILAGAVALSALPGKEKPTVVNFRANLDKAAAEASLRNLPLLFVIGKDH